MLRCVFRSGQLIAIVVFTFIALSGCSSRGSTLPSTVIVELSDGTSVEAEAGSGAASLADSVWEFRNAAGAAFVTIRFGPNGNVEAFENNTIAQEFLGSTVVFDGQRHDTDVQLLEYAAATYGAQTADEMGFSFQGQMAVFAPILGKVAWGQADSIGERDPDDPNIMTGDFSFSFTVSPNLPVPVPISEDDLSGAFPFTAHRVVEE